MISCKKIFKGKIKKKKLREIKQALFWLRTTVREILMLLGFVWLLEHYLMASAFFMVIPYPYKFRRCLKCGHQPKLKLVGHCPKCGHSYKEVYTKEEAKELL
jgi:Zn finger protein HypA/HybF involved in hydrogenase expression